MNIFSQYRGMKKEIYILFIGKFVTAMGAFVWPMLTFFLTEKLSFADDVAALIIAAASLVVLPASLLGGKLADRFSRKYIIIIFDMCTVATGVLAAILPIGYHTAVLIFFSAMFQSIETPAYDALNADFSTTAQREKAFSLSYLGYNLGFVGGASLSGILFQDHLRLAFLLNALSIFISTVLIFFFVDPRNAVGQAEEAEHPEELGPYEQPAPEGTSTLDILRQRKVLLYMILIGCVASMPNVITGMVLPLQMKNYVTDYAAIYGYMNSLNGLTVILFTPLLTLLLRRITEIPKASAGMLLFVGGMVLYASCPPTPVLFLGMFVYTLGEVVSVLGANPYASRRVPASHRGRISGISSVIGTLFYTVTQFSVSLILRVSGGNYLVIWMIFICIGILAATLYAFAYFPDKSTFPALYPKRRSKSLE